MTSNNRRATARRSRIANAIVSCLMLVTALAMWNGPAAAVTTGTLTVSDDAPDISPVMTFTYTLTKARTNAGDNLIRLTSSTGVPAGFPAYNSLSCASLLALTTITVNGTEMDKATSISTNPSVCGAFSPGSVLLVLTADAPDLAVGDTVSITFASGLFNNPSSAQTGTWRWNTSISSGGDSDEFEATLTSGGDTFSSSTSSSSSSSSSIPSDGSGGDGTGDGSGDGGEAESTTGDLGDTGLGITSLVWFAAGSLWLGFAMMRRARPSRV